MNTTIAIRTDLRDQLKELGEKGETYNEIIERLIKSARQRMLHDLLMDETDTVTAEAALARARKRWHA